MQHWYWYPMLNFLSLALTPTALIGLNKSLKVPKNFKCISAAKPSHYKYPEFIKIDKDKKKEKVQTAVLSITKKANARKDRKEGKVAAEPDSATPKKTEDAEKKDAEMKDANAEDDQKKDDEKKEKEEEPDFQELRNPTRVLKQ